MKRTYTSVIVLWLLITKLVAQIGVIDEDVLNKQKEPQYGLNRKLLFLIRASFSVYVLPLKPADSISFEFFSSNQKGAGLYLKSSISRHVNLLFALEYFMNTFSVSQKTPDKKFVYMVKHQEEMLIIDYLVGSAGIRFNIGRTGDFIGNYLDVYVIGGIPLVKKVIIKDSYGGNVPFKKLRSDYYNLNWYNDFYYGLGLRVGRKSLAVNVEYRLSRILKNSIMSIYDPSAVLYLPDLPHLLAGITLLFPL